jgi:hypothetical protein
LGSENLLAYFGNRVVSSYIENLFFWGKMNQQAQKKEPVLDKGQISKFTAFYAKLDSDLAGAQRKIEGFLEKKQA